MYPLVGTSNAVTWMMNEQVFGSVEQSTLFPDALQLDTPDVRGIFSDDLSCSYVYDGPVLTVFHSHTGLATRFDFSKLGDVVCDPLESPPNILCVSSFNKVNVLIGLEHSYGKGHLYLFNVVLSKILRSISVPLGVTSLETIHSDSDCHTLPYLSSELQSFAGLVACGTKQGQLFIIDLLLDHTVINSPPLQLHCAHPSSPAPLPDRTELFTGLHKVLCYSLTPAADAECFSYLSAAQQILYKANPEDVYISALKVVPQLGTLCVGYSFGAFQLWRLDPLVLDFSSPVDVQSPSVSHFSYQEPENDPRSFCYVWVAKCSGVASSAAALSDSMQEYVSGSVANISLHQLVYDQKTFTDEGNVLFKDLMQVGCALEHQLSPEEDVVTSWVVSCHAVSNVKSLRAGEEDSQIDVLPTDMFLTLVSWRVRYTDNSVTSHFAIFDINRWYHAQMPRAIRWYDGWCSYFSQYSFDDAIDDKVCMDLNISPNSIACYKCPRLRKLERFQYPASLSFEVKLLLPDGVLTAQYNGLQRQALLDVVASGHEVLHEPLEAFQIFFLAGLIPNNTADQVMQRKAILTTLLLHTHIEYVVHCIWEFSKSDKEVLSVEFIINWLWERLQRVINDFDSNCVPLYDWSGVLIDATVRQVLLSAITQSKNVLQIMEHIAMLKQRFPTRCLGDINVCERIAVLETRLMHMRLVWWCVSRGLLPEVKEEVTLAACFSYPYTTLKRSYNNRHSELLISSSNADNGLMIDILAKSLGSELVTALELEGGSGSYPPPNIKALVDVFLLDCPVLHKQLYFLYTMFDLMGLVDHDMNASLSNHLLSLLSTISRVDYSNIKSLVLAFWSLDHQEYEDCLTLMRQPNASQYLTSEQSDSFLTRLLCQGQAKIALDMVPIISTKHAINGDLLISIYLANGMMSAAVDSARTSQAVKSSVDRFQKILSTIKTSRELSDLLCLLLTEQEMGCVKKHLADKGDMDKLVIHLLQIGDLAEAVKLNKALNSQPLWRGDQKAKERAMTRDHLVRWQLSLLPPIQKKLLEDPNYLQMSRQKTIQPRVYRPGKSFFFGTRGAKPLAPLEIAQIVMNSAVTGSSEYKPFVQCLTPSARKSAGHALSVLREKKGTKSVTGLFDGSASSGRSGKRPRKFSDEAVPSRKSPRQDASSALLSLSAVKTLLQTPLVKRKSPQRHSRSTRTSATPHSILKIRKPQMKASPSSLLQSSPSLWGNVSPATDKLLQTASKSVSRVKFDVQESDADDSINNKIEPKAISFDEEDDDDEYAEAEVPEVEAEAQPELGVDVDTDSLMAHRIRDDSADNSDIEFNFDAPLQPLLPVHTAGRSLAVSFSDTDSSANEESFSSVPSVVASHSEPNAATPVQVGTELFKTSPDSFLEAGERVISVRYTTRRTTAMDISVRDKDLLLDSTAQTEPCAKSEGSTHQTRHENKYIAMEMTMQQKNSDSSESDSSLLRTGTLQNISQPDIVTESGEPVRQTRRSYKSMTMEMTMQQKKSDSSELESSPLRISKPQQISQSETVTESRESTIQTRRSNKSMAMEMTMQQKKSDSSESESSPLIITKSQHTSQPETVTESGESIRQTRRSNKSVAMDMTMQQKKSDSCESESSPLIITKSQHTSQPETVTESGESIRRTRRSNKSMAMEMTMQQKKSDSSESDSSPLIITKSQHTSQPETVTESGESIRQTRRSNKSMAMEMTMQQKKSDSSESESSPLIITKSRQTSQPETVTESGESIRQTRHSNKSMAMEMTMQQKKSDSSESESSPQIITKSQHTSQPETVAESGESIGQTRRSNKSMAMEMTMQQKKSDSSESESSPQIITKSQHTSQPETVAESGESIGQTRRGNKSMAMEMTMQQKKSDSSESESSPQIISKSQHTSQPETATGSGESIGQTRRSNKSTAMEMTMQQKKSDSSESESSPQIISKSQHTSQPETVTESGESIRQTRHSNKTTAMEMTMEQKKSDSALTVDVDAPVLPEVGAARRSPSRKVAPALSPSRRSARLLSTTAEKSVATPSRLASTSPPRQKLVTPAKAHATPSTAAAVSPQASSLSPNDSLRSLHLLEGEAQISGLQLREVREAAINKAANEFVFSPLPHAALTDCQVIPHADSVAHFDFAEPTQANSDSDKRVSDECASETETSTSGPPAAAPTELFSTSVGEKLVQLSEVTTVESIVVLPAVNLVDVMSHYTTHEPGPVTHEPVTHEPGPVTHEPVTHKPEPVTHEPEPVTHEPEPVTHEPEPVTHEPEPVTHVPEPVTHEPEPVTHELEPVTHEPQPVQHTTHEPESVRQHEVQHSHPQAQSPQQREQEGRPEFEFSPTVVVAAADVEVDKSSTPVTYSFTAPHAAVMATQQPASKTRSSKPIKPIGIKLPAEEYTHIKDSEDSRGRITRSRVTRSSSSEPDNSRRNTKPIRPLIVKLPDSMFKSKPTRSSQSKVPAPLKVLVAAPVATPVETPIEAPVKASGKAPVAFQPESKPSARVTRRTQPKLKPSIKKPDQPKPLSPPRRSVRKITHVVNNAADETIIAGNLRASMSRRTHKDSQSSVTSTEGSPRKGRGRRTPQSSDAEGSPRKGRGRRTSQSSDAEAPIVDAKVVDLSVIVEDAIQSTQVEEPPRTPSRRGTLKKGSQTKTDPPPEFEARRTRSQDKKAASTSNTRGRSVEPRDSATQVEIKLQSARKARQSPAKLSVQITSPRKSQSARKATPSKGLSGTSSRSTVKKTALSPILSGNAEDSTKPRTRARRKI